MLALSGQPRRQHQVVLDAEGLEDPAAFADHAQPPASHLFGPQRHDLVAEEHEATLGRVCRREITRNIVDFPAPFRPTIPTNWP